MKASRISEIRRAGNRPYLYYLVITIATGANGMSMSETTTISCLDSMSREAAPLVLPWWRRGRTRWEDNTGTAPLVA